MRKWILLILATFLLVLNMDINRPVGENEVIKQDKETPIDKTFAIIYPVAHPFFEKVTEAARENAAEVGVKIVIDAPKIASAQDQAQILQKYIEQQVDGIAIGATDPEMITPIIDKAVEKNIPVVCFDTDAPSSKRYAYIGTDNYLAGLHLGETVAKHLHYKGDLIVSSGLPTMENLRQRIKGLKAVVERYQGLSIKQISYSNGTAPNTLTNIEKMVDQYPDFDGFVGIDSLAGPAAITVWKAHGLQQKAVTFDDLPIILEGIENGQVTSTISQNQSKWGKLIVQRLSELVNGQEVIEKEFTNTIEINNNYQN
ncbi:substrate-binding domain-containing protein [Gracilibacillus caseinilyticus]|uniref:Substrate-binding domain-containing protein n=1 Tax=Gracilibacillus caseinilyticus TaxID=2932256 RepID=A0ABY4F2L3_9BACI|nr:substrate-binding domain-containing protein [Gracilibacillus caseinilyticus]UOQ50114.1 substrate-binding domain-containing protein [Gracilibacillus caseinilyticus]